ncbi:MAG: hypothetical protein ACYDA3_14055 [Gaiellaceae bacterium]
MPSTEGVSTMDAKPTVAHEGAGDYVPFVLMGEHVKGEFHCSECGYGVTIYRELPRCPMCGGESWEQKDWSPFARARNVLR